MKLFILSCTALYLFYFQPVYAEDMLSTPETEVIVRAHDGTDLSLYQYPAKGEVLILWIGGNGWHDRSIQLANDFALSGIEVWQIDFAETLMLTSNSNFMRNLDARYVADIIDAAHLRTGKRVMLFAQSYAAIPTLRGATLWQQGKTHRGVLLGSILFSPDLVTGLPALGKDPEFLPITRATRNPIMIYQGGLHGSSRQFDRLIKELNSNNPNVIFNILPGVTSLFYSEETSPAAAALLKSLPSKIGELSGLFATMAVPASKTDYVQPKQLSTATADIKLSAFAGNPTPPTINLLDARGKPYKRNNYREKITVVNFWASWCSPCIEEIPSLNHLRELMQGQPFELISINYADTPEQIRAFLKRVNVEFPVLVDPNGKVSQQWNVIGFPSTFVIGRDGQIKYGVNAAIHWDTPEVVDALKALNR